MFSRGTALLQERSKMESNQRFATEKPTRLYFSIALPGMISMLAMSVYTVIEGIFIGQLIGEVAFAAINIAIPFVMINFSLADLVGVGSSVPISIALGKKENRSANNYFTCSFILIFSAAALMGLILFFASPLLVELMGAKGELAELAVKYVRVYAILGPVTTLIFAMDNYLRISGYVKFSMFINIFMSIFTAGLLFLFLGVIKMNVEGSALATCISMTVCAVIASIPFLRGKTVLKFTKPKFTVAMFKKIAACGTPAFLNNVAGRVASIVMNSALLRIGGQTATAAYSVLMYSNDIIQPMLYGMCDSIQPAIGYNWGAGLKKRVRALKNCTITACAIVSFIGCAVMFLLPEQICSLFVKPEETELMSLSVQAMRLFCSAYIVRWLGFALQSFFNAIEKPLQASILSVAGAMVFPIIFVFALTPMGLDGLWLNFTFTSLCVSVMAYIMYRFQRKNIVD